MSAVAMRSPAMAQWFDRIKDAVPLSDLCERLGLKRNGANGNFHSPHHRDKSASLSIVPGDKGWKDWSTEKGGSCIDLVMYCKPDVATPVEAAQWIAQEFSIPAPRSQPESIERREKSICEFIAERSLATANGAKEYLTGRGISEEAIDGAIKARSLGWNTWRSDKKPEGECGHGGPAAAFIVREPTSGRVVGVDLRFADPAINGGVKTQCQGAKEGFWWTSNPTRLKQAHTVYLVESPINALSVESCPLPSGTAALAIRGTANAAKVDLSMLRGKRVVVALDHSDPVNEHTGQRPGLAAAWTLLDRLTASDLGARLVDMQDWDEGEDINDVLSRHGADELAKRLRQFDAWLVPGMPGGGERLEGTRRFFLPEHDMRVYWRYRVREDFTHYVEEVKSDENDEKIERTSDLCSFRVASISRLKVQGHMATIDGTTDRQPECLLGLTVQTARHGAELQRKVIDDDELYNLDRWRTLGAIFRPQQFQRMLSIFERSAAKTERDVVNFVGLAWRDRTPTAVEGRDCFFVDPVKQCLYHNLSFPRGTREAAAECLRAYQATFTNNAASIALVWALGAHLKAILGFYPHFQMQAEKGSGKSRLLESMQTSLAFQVLSGQMLKTDHRRRASVSWTSHPVGWDEFSKLPKHILSEIDGLLQSTYRFEFTRIGANLTPYLMCAPVLLAGEEVDVVSLQSKLCRTSLSMEKQGALIPRDLPQFPMWEWLKFIEATAADRVTDIHRQCLDDALDNLTVVSSNDPTARRMVENYAAILAAWRLLCDFSGLNPSEGGFIPDCLAEMNAHVAETNDSRLPWFSIMEIALSEIESDRYLHPRGFGTRKDKEDHEEELLFIRPTDIMDHISTAVHLRPKFDALPIKKAGTFKKQLLKSGIVVAEDVERRIGSRRCAHMMGLSIQKMDRMGLCVTVREE